MDIGNMMLVKPLLFRLLTSAIIGCAVICGLSPPVAGQWIPLIPVIPNPDVRQEVVEAGTTSVSLKPGDQLWLVSTRHWLSGAQGCDFQICRFRDGNWRSADVTEFQQDLLINSDLQNLIHVHGNFTDAGWALRRGVEVYQNAVLPVAPRPAVRMVIWSWDSERTAVPIRDFNIKTQRSVVEGSRLTQFMQQTAINEAVLIGYSMGAQTVLTSLAEIATVSTQRWHVLLTAPAIAPQFCPSSFASQFDSAVAEMIVLTNCRDRALKNARRLHRLQHDAPSLDQYELVELLPLTAGKLTVVETAAEVGSKHSINRYSQSGSFRQAVATLLLNAAEAQGFSRGPVLDENFSGQ